MWETHFVISHLQRKQANKGASHVTPTVGNLTAFCGTWTGIEGISFGLISSVDWYFFLSCT